MPENAQNQLPETVQSGQYQAQVTHDRMTKVLSVLTMDDTLFRRCPSTYHHVPGADTAHHQNQQHAAFQYLTSR